MYATLNFSAGWVSHTAAIARAITSLVCGASLSSINSEHLSATTFNLSKSTRRADNADHFWIQDSANVCHAPCATVVGQNKFARFTETSGNILFNLSPTVDFIRQSSVYVYRSAINISNSLPIVLHIFCTKRAIVTAICQEHSGKPSVTTILSELTYDLMPYMEDNTGNYIPAVIGEFGYSPTFSGASSGDSDDPFHCPYVVINVNTGQSNPLTTTNWRVGNASTAYNPLSRTLGNTRITADGSSSAEAFLPLGVQASTLTTLFSGSITDKSGIMITNGVGHPIDSTIAPNCMSPDTLLELNGQNYMVLDRLLVPYI